MANLHKIRLFLWNPGKVDAGRPEHTNPKSTFSTHFELEEQEGRMTTQELKLSPENQALLFKEVIELVEAAKLWASEAPTKENS